MIALVIGALGFCGRHLVARLRQDPETRVVGVDIHEMADVAFLDDCFTADATDFRRLSRVVRDVQPDQVFYLAGLATGPAEAIHRVNTLGCVNTLESVIAEKPDARVLTVGSAAEYGMVAERDNPISERHPCNPVGNYGVSKYAATLAASSYARLHRLKVVVVRPFNIVGPGIPPSLVVGAVLERAMKALETSDPVVEVGNVNTQRDFIAVEDAVESYVRAIASENWGKVFNVCTGRPRSIKSVLETLLSFSPCPIRLEVSEALLKPADVPVIYGDPSMASVELGFTPARDLTECLREAWVYAVAPTHPAPMAGPTHLDGSQGDMLRELSVDEA